jgi:hypothetical protein
MSAIYFLLLFPSFAMKWRSKSAKSQPRFEGPLPKPTMHDAKKNCKRKELEVRYLVTTRVELATLALLAPCFSISGASDLQCEVKHTRSNQLS